MSDQTGICTGQKQKCLKDVRCLTVISYSVIQILRTVADSLVV